MNLNWLIPAKGGPMSQPASRKIYVTGSRPDLRVPVREVCLHGGEAPPRLYDTSGPWTDPDANPDIKLGLPPLRLPWILGRADIEELPGPTSGYRRGGGGQHAPGRGDIEELPGPTSAYRRRRDDDPALGGVRFASVRRPLRARPGRVVTQLH